MARFWAVYLEDMGQRNELLYTLQLLLNMNICTKYEKDPPVKLQDRHDFCCPIYSQTSQVDDMIMGHG